MLSRTYRIDLTRQELDEIEAALHTQAKILSLQNDSGNGNPAQTRLHDLKSVLKSLKRQRHHSRKAQMSARPMFWPGRALSLFTRPLKQ